MKAPVVCYVSMTNGDELLTVNGDLITHAESCSLSSPVFQTAAALAKSLAVPLIEYNGIPEPDFDDWVAEDVMCSLPDNSFINIPYCTETSVSDLGCDGGSASDSRSRKVVTFLINTYKMDVHLAEVLAERGEYSYVRAGNLASEFYYKQSMVSNDQNNCVDIRTH